MVACRCLRSYLVTGAPLVQLATRQIGCPIMLLDPLDIVWVRRATVNALHGGEMMLDLIGISSGDFLRRSRWSGHGHLPMAAEVFGRFCRFVGAWIFRLFHPRG